jgi:hypothetical protein
LRKLLNNQQRTRKRKIKKKNKIRNSNNKINSIKKEKIDRGSPKN